MSSEVTYRMVAGGNALGAAQYLADQQHYIPPPERTVFWVAEREGIIVGAVALTNTPVVESFCVDEAGTAKGLFNAAHEWVANAQLPRIYAHTSHSYMERLMKDVGFVPVAEEFYLLERKREATKVA